MEEKKNILTYQGLRKYEDELHDLKVVKRQEVAQKIKEAREQGDLSENAEYDAVTCNVIGLCCNFFYQLCTHVLECIFQLDFLCNGNTIIGN